MAKDLSIEMPTKGLDDLFSTQEQREDEKLERVRDIPVDVIDNFPGHPFKVIDDESMTELADSISSHGVQTPIVVRQKEDGRYELISGHRRKRACEIAGVPAIPSIVRVMSRDEAILFMVESNLQRERILPSEKAFAYKMKLDAMKRQGARTDLTSTPMVGKLRGKESAAIIGEQSGESHEQVRRYIRLTELVTPILDMVDENRIAFRPAVELSYLPAEKQEILYAIMGSDDCTPSLAQAIKMKQFEQNGKLTEEVIYSIMAEEKPNQVEMFKMPKKAIEHFFPPGTKKKEAEEIIVKALEQYFGRTMTQPERVRERGLER